MTDPGAGHCLLTWEDTPVVMGNVLHCLPLAPKKQTKPKKKQNKTTHTLTSWCKRGSILKTFDLSR